MAKSTDEATPVETRIRALTDDELDVIYADMTHGLSRAPSDAVAMVLRELIHAVYGEGVRRRQLFHTLEADLQGGHLVEVVEGNQIGTYSAMCDPKPADDDYCWRGPDRDTIEEAVEDGRAHNPGYEPTVDVSPGEIGP